MSANATIVRASGAIAPAPWSPARALNRPDVRPLLEIDPVDRARGRTASDLVLPSASAERTAAVERDAYDRGFVDGQSAGVEPLLVEARARLARISTTLAELDALRSGMLRRSEHDVVRLATAIAERILSRELRADPDLLLHMALAGLRALGGTQVATIQMHPDDLSAVPSGHAVREEHSPIRLSANPNLRPGACVVQTSFGTIDVGLDAQIREILDGLAGDGAAG